MERKSIEERAHEFGLKKCGGTIHKGTKGMIYQAYKDMYRNIAGEQKEEDISSAIKFMQEEYGFLWNEEIREDFIEFMNNEKEGTD